MIRNRASSVPAVTLLLFASMQASGQQVIYYENFDTVVGDATEVLVGAGFNDVDGWDSGIEGEWAYAGTFGDGSIGSVVAQGIPTGGMFNSGAGLLEVNNATFMDGGWFSGLFWPDITLPTLDDSKLNLHASIKGNQLFGEYQVRIEAQKLVPFGLDDDFSEATGIGGGTFLGPGGVNGWIPNFDTGIEGEAAFAGVFGGAEVFGGVSARATVLDGIDGFTAELIVDAVSFGPGSGWYAGMVWANQQLPSTDLSAIELSADILGTANAGLGEQLGNYALRIEDANQDWIAFSRSATGNVQSVGGLLSTGIEGGFDDQLFDPTAGPFSVVLVFDNDLGNTWGFGGTLKIDNLFLTGGSSAEQVGQVSFTDSVTSTSSFKSGGGLLLNGTSTFNNLDENFSEASLTGGGEFFNSTSGAEGFTPGWDEGLEGEAAFSGYWGSVAVDGGVSARATANGGMGGGRAAELKATEINVVGTGGWWAGLMWRDQALPDLPLDQIFLTADIKGIAAPGGGLGKYHLRIEDGNNDYLAFTGLSNGAFQSVGGPLSDATEGTFIGDGTFDLDDGPFTVVVAFFDEWASWGPGGTLIADNLFLTPAAFGTGADVYTAAVSYFEEPDSWGGQGELIVDDVLLVETGTDTDSDGDTDLSDFASLQNCMAEASDFDPAECLILDFDGDFDIDSDDHGSFVENFDGPE